LSVDRRKDKAHQDCLSLSDRAGSEWGRGQYVAQGESTGPFGELRTWTLRSLRKLGISPRRAFGQHFLTDRRALAQILQCARLPHASAVLEIGPGLGALTEALLRAGHRVIAVELDRRLVPFLRERFRNDEVVLVEGDALSLDFQAFREEYVQGQPMHLVSNLPYQIATPLLLRLLSLDPPLASLTVMVQREVGERLLARPGSKAYGALSLVVALFARGEVCLHLRPGAFTPQPKVESSVVHLIPYPAPLLSQKEERGAFVEFLFGVFRHRRKTLANNLKLLFPERRENWNSLLETWGISSSVRPEELSLKDYLNLARRIGIVREFS